METLAKLIEAIHQALPMLVLEFTGAGSQALAWLHSQGGSSRTILEANDRYAAASLVETIGFEPEQFASQPVAQALALRAYLRAMRLARPNIPVIGVGCTAAIATDRLTRGDHRGYVATYEGRQMTHYGLTLTKGLRTRQEEEQVVSLLILRAIAKSFDLGEAPALPLAAAEALTEETQEMDLLDQLMAEALEWVLVWPDGRMSSGQAAANIALLSGSFNPLHEGHRQMAAIAAKHLGCDVYFELPVLNADKAPLGSGEIRRRLAQFAGLAPVILSRSPLFSQKAALFPHTVFVLGVDTAERLVQPRFYEHDPAKLRAALHAIRQAGCRFLVAGRLKEDKFMTLSDVSLPEGFRELFEQIPEESFRVDVSSTMLREANRYT
jgi:hypothetical protein